MRDYARFLALLITKILAVQVMLSQTHLESSGNKLITNNPIMTTTVRSGIRYRGLIEYRFDFSQGYSVGVTAASTGSLDEYGVLGRWQISENERPLRFSLANTATYCKDSYAGDRPTWLMVWPRFEGELKLKAGQRISAGIGAAMAAARGNQRRMWNTFQAGLGVPINKNLNFEYKISSSMKGFRLAKNSWILGPALMMTFGLSYQLN